MKNKKGSTIVWAITLIMVLVVIVGASLSFAYMSYNQSIKNRNKTQVELIANSAIKSLAGAIENDENSSQLIPNTGKQINVSKMECSVPYGTISNIKINRKKENLIIASLKANYHDEDYTIYAYLTQSNNQWKCVQYDTNGNRDISTDSSSNGNDSGNNGSTDNNTGNNNGEDSGNTNSNKDAISLVKYKIAALLNAYYQNDKDINKFNEWYQQECQNNNVSFENKNDWQFNNGGFIKGIFDHLYNKDGCLILDNSLYDKIIEVNKDLGWIKNYPLYLHFNLNTSNGEFFLTANGQNNSWNYSETYLLFIDNHIYVKKSGSLQTNGMSEEQLEQLIQTDDWQMIE